MEPLSQDAWSRLRPTLEEALGMPEPERAALVRARLADDPALVARALELLARDAGYAAPGPLRAAPAELAAGDTIGVWRIERELARGGMGTVYVARRDVGGFEQRAAVKVVRQGMESPEAVRMFVRERQLLARLEHPGIARLLDGGLTADQRPFLAMELVDGLPLDRAIAERGLDLRGRLGLFREICAAVSFLHRNLVVHRDLKPSNVLVTADGRPKLVDFGLAKLLEEDPAAATATRERFLTPSYASPEQLRGEAVTTASDVYSLGVLLYELLVGRRPHDDGSRGSAELARAVLEQAPAAPSAACGDAALARRLRGDLDTIALTALRGEPERRYASVDELAEDVRRHLALLPLRARPERLSYRLSRFARRNRPAAVAATLLSISLVGGTAAAWTLYVRQRAARQEADAKGALAELRFDELRDLTAGFLIDLHDRLYRFEGSTSTRRVLVATTVDALERLAAQRPDDLELRLAMARAWRRVGLAQGDPNWESLGDYEQALASHERASALFLTLPTEPGEASLAALERARNERNRGVLLAFLGRSTEALVALDEALARARPALGGPLEAQALEVLMPAARDRAALLFERGRYAESAEQRAEGAALRERLATRSSDAGLEPPEGLVLARTNEASAMAARGEAPAAVAALREVLAVTAPGAGTDAGMRRRRAIAQIELGRALIALRETDEAGALLEEALGSLEALAAADPQSAFSAGALATAHEALAGHARALGELDRELDELARALEVRAELAEEHGAAQLRRQLAEARDELGERLRAAGRAQEALVEHAAALALFDALAIEDPARERTRRDRAVCLYAEARAHLALHDAGRGTPPELAAHLARARARVAESAAILDDQRAHGVLLEGDEQRLAGMRDTLVQFDATLARYRGEGLLDD